MLKCLFLLDFSIISFIILYDIKSHQTFLQVYTRKTMVDVSLQLTGEYLDPSSFVIESFQIGCVKHDLKK